MPKHNRERLPHILVTNTASTQRYTSPRSGRSKIITTPKRDRQSHAAALLSELTQVGEAIPSILESQKAAGFHAVNGIYLSFESEPDFDLKFESLEFQPSGIELCVVKKENNKTLATVFVPDGKLSCFLKKISAYKDENTKAGKPRNRPLIESISHIKLAALEALWTDSPKLFPPPEIALWWEVWLFKAPDIDHEAFLRKYAEKLNIIVSKEAVHFLDRTVVLIYATREQMSHSVHLLTSFAELRQAKDTASFFTRLDRIEQRSWIEDALARLEPPHEQAPAVCLLDTGVNHNHPLLSPAAISEDMHTYEPAWGTDDRCGHGTPMAGLTIYGDLVEPLASVTPIRLSHHLESVKITPDPSHHKDKRLYGAITRESIARAEIKSDRHRLFCMAITCKDGCDRGRPSSWSSTIDALAAGYEDEQRRLIIISAGNTVGSERCNYPDSNLTDAVHDPGQAWNALTVGAYTDKVDLDTQQYPGWKPIAPAGDISPASCTSMEWGKNNWPIKPDIVMEGGNMALSPVDGTADYIDDALQLLSTGHQFGLGKYLISFGDTSAATALAARLAVMLKAQYPNFWPETSRALLIHSARWTEAMKARFGSLRTQDDYRKLLRYCGYGVPDVDELAWSARNSLTLVVQDELQPFLKEDGKIKTCNMNFHALPWPTTILQDLGDTNVEMRVTLSYFIEPNPGERGWAKKYSYQSHGLRFDVRRSLETMQSFKQRINRQIRDEEYNARTVSETGDWILGERLRTIGSIHSDMWQGSAAELAARGYVAVYPVLGWWKERPTLERWSKRARQASTLRTGSQHTNFQY